MAEWLTVLTTTDSRDKALALARGAVGARLVACAQVGGSVTSVYRWEGVTETAEEWQVLFKTVGARYEELEAYIKRAHDYETPEIIATAVVCGSAEYLAWVAEETRLPTTVRRRPRGRVVPINGVVPAHDWPLGSAG